MIWYVYKRKCSFRLGFSFLIYITIYKSKHNRSRWAKKVHGKFQATYNIQRNNSTVSFQRKKKSKKKSTSKKKLRKKKSSFHFHFPDIFGPSKTSVLGYPQVVGRPRNWIIEPLQDRFILHRIQPEKSKTHKNLEDPNSWRFYLYPKLRIKTKNMVYTYTYIKGIMCAYSCLREEKWCMYIRLQ